MKTLLLLLMALPCHGAVYHRAPLSDFQTALSADKVYTYMQNTSSVSLSCWVKYTVPDNGASHEIMAHGQIGFSGHILYGMRSQSTEHLEFIYANPDASYQLWDTSGTTVQTNSWMHLAVTFNYGTGSSLRFYINGTNANGSWVSGTGNLLGLTNTSTFYVGRAESSSAYFYGPTSEIAVWNVALNPIEVKNLSSKVHGMPKQIRPSALVLYVPCDDIPEGAVMTTYPNRYLDRGTNSINLDQGGIAFAERACSYPPNE